LREIRELISQFSVFITLSAFHIIHDYMSINNTLNIREISSIEILASRVEVVGQMENIVRVPGDNADIATGELLIIKRCL